MVFSIRESDTSNLANIIERIGLIVWIWRERPLAELAKNSRRVDQARTHH